MIEKLSYVICTAAVCFTVAVVMFLSRDLQVAKVEVACRKAVDNSKDRKVRKDPLGHYLECVEGNTTKLLQGE